MNAIAFLLGLLVLAYVGSILVGGRAIRGFGLASGAGASRRSLSIGRRCMTLALTRRANRVVLSIACCEPCAILISTNAINATAIWMPRSDWCRRSAASSKSV